MGLFTIIAESGSGVSTPVPAPNVTGAGTVNVLYPIYDGVEHWSLSIPVTLPSNVSNLAYLIAYINGPTVPILQASNTAPIVLIVAAGTDLAIGQPVEIIQATVPQYDGKCVITALSPTPSGNIYVTLSNLSPPGAVWSGTGLLNLYQQPRAISGQIFGPFTANASFTVLSEDLGPNAHDITDYLNVQVVAYNSASEPTASPYTTSSFYTLGAGPGPVTSATVSGFYGSDTSGNPTVTFSGTNVPPNGDSTFAGELIATYPWTQLTSTLGSSSGDTTISFSAVVNGFVDGDLFKVDSEYMAIVSGAGNAAIGGTTAPTNTWTVLRNVTPPTGGAGGLTTHAIGAQVFGQGLQAAFPFNPSDLMLVAVVKSPNPIPTTISWQSAPVRVFCKTQSVWMSIASVDGTNGIGSVGTVFVTLTPLTNSALNLSAPDPAVDSRYVVAAGTGLAGGSGTGNPLQTAVVSSANLQLNPGFDLTPIGNNWVLGAGMAIAETGSSPTPRSSPNVLEINAGILGVAYNPNLIPVLLPGQLFQASCYVQSVGGATGSLFIKTDFYDASGAFIVSVPSPAFVATSSWTLYTTGPATAPSNAVYTRLVIQVTATGSGAWYIDDTNFVSLTPAGQSVGFNAAGQLIINTAGNLANLALNSQFANLPLGTGWQTQNASFTTDTGVTPNVTAALLIPPSTSSATCEIFQGPFPCVAGETYFLEVNYREQQTTTAVSQLFAILVYQDANGVQGTTYSVNAPFTTTYGTLVIQGTLPANVPGGGPPVTLFIYVQAGMTTNAHGGILVDNVQLYRLSPVSGPVGTNGTGGLTLIQKGVQTEYYAIASITAASQILAADSVLGGTGNALGAATVQSVNVADVNAYQVVSDTSVIGQLIVCNIITEFNIVSGGSIITQNGAYTVTIGGGASVHVFNSIINNGYGSLVSLDNGQIDLSTQQFTIGGRTSNFEAALGLQELVLGSTTAFDVGGFNVVLAGGVSGVTGFSNYPFSGLTISLANGGSSATVAALTGGSIDVVGGVMTVTEGPSLSLGATPTGITLPTAVGIIYVDHNGHMWVTGPGGSTQIST